MGKSISKFITKETFTLVYIGYIVVTEFLENLSITREFRISKRRVSAALDWLIANNQLYSDVENVTNDIEFKAEDFIKIDEKKPEMEVLEKVKYVRINDYSRIIRANFHQGMMTELFPDNAGRQCCAMALAFIVKQTQLNPSSWDTNTVNEVLIEGDGCYQEIRILTGVNFPQSGFINVRNFDVIKNDFLMFENAFSIIYADEPEIFGCLDDRMNRSDEVAAKSLREGLEELFKNHSAGILIAVDKCFAAFHSGEYYYFADSHGCGPKGAPSIKENSKTNSGACVVQCKTLDELCRIAKRATGSRAQYTLDFIDVIVKNNIVNLKAEQEIQQPTEDIQKVDVIPVQTSVMMQIDAHQPVEEDVLVDVPKEDRKVLVKSLKKKSFWTNKKDQTPNDVELKMTVNRVTKGNIVNVRHELKAEEFAWFYLFPFGVNGLRQEGRQVDITPLDYFQSRILGSDLRFQRTDYLFYALSMFEFYKINANLGVFAKKIQLNNQMVQDINMYVKNLRGSAAYWRNALNELIGQIRCLGPPHYFLTFSCNDFHWSDMIEAMLAANKDNRNPMI